jgi:uncharacterized phage-associated protein
MPTPYRPLALANQFISLSGSSGLEHMKIQKLVYISYGWWLAYQPNLLLNEQPQVWKHGPVFASLYNVLKEFGRREITTKQTDNPFMLPPEIDDSDSLVDNLINWIWQRYGSKSAYELSDLTHQPGSPWEQVAREHNFRVPFHTEIPVQVIREHYRGLASEFTSSAA